MVCVKALLDQQWQFWNGQFHRLGHYGPSPALDAHVSKIGILGMALQCMQTQVVVAQSGKPWLSSGAATQSGFAECCDVATTHSQVSFLATYWCQSTLAGSDKLFVALDLLGFGPGHRLAELGANGASFVVAVMPTDHQAPSVTWVAQERTGWFFAGPSQTFLQKDGTDLGPFHVDGDIGVIFHLDDSGDQSCIHSWRHKNGRQLEKLLCLWYPATSVLLVEVSISLLPCRIYCLVSWRNFISSSQVIMFEHKVIQIGWNHKLM